MSPLDHSKSVMSIVRAATIQRLECPYCHYHGSILYCFQAVSLTADDFGRLLQLGWCRCGSLIYRPDPSTRCCPQFSMRIRTKEFVPNAKQRKVIRKLSQQPQVRYLGRCLESALRNLRLIRFAIDYPYPHWFLRVEKSVIRSDVVTTIVDVLSPDERCATIRNQLQHLIVHELQRFPNIALASYKFDGSGSLVMTIPSDDRCSFCDCGADDDYIWTRFLTKTTKSETFLLPYWKTIRIESEALARWESTSKRPPKLKTVPSSLCTRHDHHHRPSHADSERERHPSGALFDSTIDDNLEISMEPCRFSEEKFQLYVQYQLQVHGDSCDHTSRERFQESMVRTPILSTANGFGSFHRCYRRRDTGELIAFSLLDVVPEGINSQYFVWSQQWRQLNLGIFSILDEIQMIERQHGIRPYLYLGIYVESCSKMSYKKQFLPSELRTPSGWIATELACDAQLQDPWLDSACDLNCIPMEKICPELMVRVDSRIVRFGQYRLQATISYEQLRELYLFCLYVGGGNLARRFIYALR